MRTENGGPGGGGKGGGVWNRAGQGLLSSAPRICLGGGEGGGMGAWGGGGCGMRVARREALGVRRTLFHCVMTSDSPPLCPLLPFLRPFLHSFLNSRGMLTRGAKAANDDDSESAVFDDALMALQVSSRPFWLHARILNSPHTSCCQFSMSPCAGRARGNFWKFEFRRIHSVFR